MCVQDKTVIVADFGLARIVQRTASSTLERSRNHHHTLRRKRYTVPTHLATLTLATIQF